MRVWRRLSSVWRLSRTSCIFMVTAPTATVSKARWAPRRKGCAAAGPQRPAYSGRGILCRHVHSLFFQWRRSAVGTDWQQVWFKFFQTMCPVSWDSNFLFFLLVCCLLFRRFISRIYHHGKSHFTLYSSGISRDFLVHWKPATAIEAVILTVC